MRKEFTKIYEKLSSKQKSLLISVGAIVLATLLLFALRAVFPSYDLSQTELVIVTASSGFIASLIKDYVKLA